MTKKDEIAELRAEIGALKRQLSGADEQLPASELKQPFPKYRRF